jgi:hypothetical protein
MLEKTTLKLSRAFVSCAKCCAKANNAFENPVCEVVVFIILQFGSKDTAP